jgi:16S rRNA (guanine527-N7)-methyltransferase
VGLESDPEVESEEGGADAEAESQALVGRVAYPVAVAEVERGADPEVESKAPVERGAEPEIELGAEVEGGADLVGAEAPEQRGLDSEPESEEPAEPEPDPQAEALFGERGGLARQYAAKLATTGVAWGLIGPAEADRVWERHIVNSVALSELIPQGARVIDVGSGAGLPGIPLALARPDLVVTLLEPSLRRSGFLALTAIELGLDSAVVRARAEDHDEDADVVVARAVAPLGRLVGWTRHLFKRGELLALKGEKAAAEVQAAAAVLKRWRLQAEVVTCSPVEGATATVVRVRPKG